MDDFLLLITLGEYVDSDEKGRRKIIDKKMEH